MISQGYDQWKGKVKHLFCFTFKSAFLSNFLSIILEIKGIEHLPVDTYTDGTLSQTATHEANMDVYGELC